jgi:energy-coupling factor transport system permease protein
VMLAGCVLAGIGLVTGGRRTRRSRYRPDPWALPEWLVTTSGVIAAAGTFAADPLALQLAGPLAIPPVPSVTVAALLVAITPAFTSPPVPADSSAEQAPERARSPIGVMS